MKIEEGKYYKTRNGRKAGPIELIDSFKWGNQPLRYKGVIDGDKENRQTWYEYGRFFEDREAPLDLVEEWNSDPKLWRDMSDEEKGALLLANHRGETIQASPAVGPTAGPVSWRTVGCPVWDDDSYYRVKPERAPVAVCADLYDSMSDFITEIAMCAKTSEHARDEMFMLSVESLRPERDGYIEAARKIVAQMPEIDRTAEKIS